MGTENIEEEKNVKYYTKKFLKSFLLVMSIIALFVSFSVIDSIYRIPYIHLVEFSLLIFGYYKIKKYFNKEDIKYIILSIIVLVFIVAVSP